MSTAAAPPGQLRDVMRTVGCLPWAFAGSPAKGIGQAMAAATGTSLMYSVQKVPKGGTSA